MIQPVFQVWQRIKKMAVGVRKFVWIYEQSQLSAVVLIGDLQVNRQFGGKHIDVSVRAVKGIVPEPLTILLLRDLDYIPAHPPCIFDAAILKLELVPVLPVPIRVIVNIQNSNPVEKILQQYRVCISVY
ncbi:MAG: hypothetical protein DWB42_10730 [Chloroflexi bacterium]|nr:hypothetical protein [Chloroflexota bacterium]